MCAGQVGLPWQEMVGRENVEQSLPSLGARATGVAPSPTPTGSDSTAVLRRTTAPEAGLTDMSVAEVEWAGDQAAPPGAALCFGRLLDREGVASVPVRGALTGAASLV